jgi:hypothetical protein
LGERLTIYGTVGTVIGGLGSIVVSVYLGGKGGRVTMLRAENGTALRANWRMTLIATALAAMLGRPGCGRLGLHKVVGHAGRIFAVDRESRKPNGGFWRSSQHNVADQLDWLHKR